MRKIILASKSPRRKELFGILGIPFVCEESNFEEDIEQTFPPRELACYLAQGKAQAVAPKHPNAIIIAADTLIALGNQVLGKPHTPEKAREMLQMMSGKSHSVITGYAILDTQTNKAVSRAVETKVYFRKLSAKEIENYVKTKQPLDKAGSYGIQGLGQLLIQKIEGDYSNVVGLPLSALAQDLKKFGVKII